MKNGSLKSHGFVVNLYATLIRDLRQHYPELGRDLDRDLLSIKKRLLSEGLSFATKTLPRFGKALDKVLANGGRFVTPDFKKSGRTGLPAFLRGFLERILEKDGTVKTIPDTGAILEVRQICYLLYKLEMPFDESILDDKTRSFIAADVVLPSSGDHLSRKGCAILERARALITALFADFKFDALPKHGPGAVAGGEKPWEKIRNFRYYSQFEEAFPFDEWFFLSPTHLADELDLDAIEVEYGLSRLEFVPKDSRGPRIIAMEPKEYMWLQQAIKTALYRYVEMHPLTRGCVNFTDQSINRQLALQASIDQINITLDLKDASDNVSLWLVKELFRNTSLLSLLLATRTPGVILPDGRVHFYKKFAPMGSALCFPIEALCFWAICAAAAAEVLEKPLTLCARSTYVFGDDLIVPRDFFHPIDTHFPEFSFVLSRDKCCVDGIMRESCGCDAVRGVDVTPIKLKTDFHPLLRRVSNTFAKKGNKAKRRRPSFDAQSVTSYVEASNAFYQRGYFNLGNLMKELVESYLKSTLPIETQRGTNPLSFRGFTYPQSLRPRLRWNNDLQRTESFEWATRPVKFTEASVDDWCHLFYTVITGQREDGPGTWAVPRRSRLIKRWLPT